MSYKFQYSGILSENLLLLLKKDENIVTSSSFITPMKVHFVEKYKNRRAINNRGHNSKILFLTLRLLHKKGIKIAF